MPKIELRTQDRVMYAGLCGKIVAIGGVNAEFADVAFENGQDATVALEALHFVSRPIDATAELLDALTWALAVARYGRKSERAHDQAISAALKTTAVPA
jgi:hypothetical protein